MPSGLRGPSGGGESPYITATTTFRPRLPCLLALRSGANAAAAFRVLAGPTRIRRQQQPGLGVCGRCRSRPSARGVDSERRGESGRVPCGGREPRSASRDHLASSLLLSQPAPPSLGSWERVPRAELRPTMPQAAA